MIENLDRIKRNKTDYVVWKYTSNEATVNLTYLCILFFAGKKPILVVSIFIFYVVHRTSFWYHIQNITFKRSLVLGQSLIKF